MTIVVNTTQRLEGCQTSHVNDDALEAEIRAQLRFSWWLGRIVITFLLCAGVLHFLAISL